VFGLGRGSGSLGRHWVKPAPERGRFRENYRGPGRGSAKSGEYDGEQVVYLSWGALGSKGEHSVEQFVQI
jgi:hypothetical protein